MKKVVGISLILCVLCLSVVNAIPNNFEVSNVYWATEGTLENFQGVEKPFLLGLVELSWKEIWEGKEFETKSPLVYLKYNGEEFYSYSLGLTKESDLSKNTFPPAEFFPLSIYARGGKAIDQISYLSLFIPISEEGKIDFEKIAFSEFRNKTLAVPDSFRTEESNTEDLFSDFSSIIGCSKTISFDPSSTEMCDDDTMPIEEYRKCREENQRVRSITFRCGTNCLRKYYEDLELNDVNKFCFIYEKSAINFSIYTSGYMEFDKWVVQNPRLNIYNPWRFVP